MLKSLTTSGISIQHDTKTRRRGTKYLHLRWNIHRERKNYIKRKKISKAFMIVKWSHSPFLDIVHFADTGTFCFLNKSFNLAKLQMTHISIETENIKREREELTNPRHHHRIAILPWGQRPMRTRILLLLFK